jgi:hypothetical protein
MIRSRILRPVPEPAYGNQDHWRWAPPPTTRGQRRRHLHRLAQRQNDARLYRAAWGDHVCQVIAVPVQRT